MLNISSHSVLFYTWILFYEYVHSIITLYQTTDWRLKSYLFTELCLVFDIIKRVSRDTWSWFTWEKKKTASGIRCVVVWGTAQVKLITLTRLCSWSCCLHVLESPHSNTPDSNYQLVIKQLKFDNELMIRIRCVTSPKAHGDRGVELYFRAGNKLI